MKTLYIKCLVFSLGLLLLNSCNTSDQTSSLFVAPLEFHFGATSNERTFVVDADESWEIVTPADASWCTFTPDKQLSGRHNVTIHVDPLPTTASRSAIFTVKTSTTSKDFLVEQTNTVDENQYIGFYNKPDDLTIIEPIDTTTYKIYVKTNVSDWNANVSADAQSWLSYTKDKDTLFITVLPNESTSGRTGKITCQAGGSLSASLDFRQYGLTEPGSKLPDFTLSIPDSTGTDLSLYDVIQNGRVYTILYFWGSWCSDCKGFLPKMKELYEYYHELGLGIYGVALEIEGTENEYKQYLIDNGLEDVDSEGKKIYWENRPVFNPAPQRKVNAFTRQFYGNDMNYVPAVIIVNGNGTVQKRFIDSYSTSTEAGANQLYYKVEQFFEKFLDCGCND